MSHGLYVFASDGGGFCFDIVTSLLDAVGPQVRESQGSVLSLYEGFCFYIGRSFGGSIWS